MLLYYHYLLLYIYWHLNSKDYILLIPIKITIIKSINKKEPRDDGILYLTVGKKAT